jgi:CRISPR-associated protein Cmr2
MTEDYGHWLAVDMKRKLAKLAELGMELDQARVGKANREELRKLRNEVDEEFKKIYEVELKLSKVDQDGWVSASLASGLIDDMAVWRFADLAFKDRGFADIYSPIVKGIQIPEDSKEFEILQLEELFHCLPVRDWLGLQVHFKLLTPWHSRDDRTFHVLDNPLRKDWVFGVPLLAAASWKGVLRWAFRMENRLIGPNSEKKGETADRARAIEVHLFGNEQGEARDFRQGALVFYATAFRRLGFEVINPHWRKTRAGKLPIFYEVVPPRSRGVLRILYAPTPVSGRRRELDRDAVLVSLLKAIEALLTKYGISAKRTAGWDTAEIVEWRGFRKGKALVQERTIGEFRSKLGLPDQGGDR